MYTVVQGYFSAQRGKGGDDGKGMNQTEGGDEGKGMNQTVVFRFLQ